MAGKWQETVYGPFPRRFRVASLSELCDGQRGIQTGPFGSQLHSKDYVSTGTPIATVEHLGENRIIHHNLPLVSDFDRDRLSKYTLRRGDILFSRVGSVDRRGLVRKAEEGWLFSGRCLRVRPNTEKIDPVYLSYFFGLWAFKEYIRSIAVGATMPSLNTALLGSVPIVYPPLSEQRAIADGLRTLDDKIELNRRINETLEEMARALFKSWFVDFDPVRATMEGRWHPGKSLPGLPADLYNLFPNRLVDSQLGPIPDGWQVRAIDEIAAFRNGLALQKYRPQQGEDRLPVVKIAQLREGRVGKKEWASAGITPECIIEDGDVVFSWSGSLMVKIWCGGRAALNQHLFKVTSSEYPKWFYLHWTLTYLESFRRTAAGKATTMGHIKRQHLSESLCAVPSNPVLKSLSVFYESLVAKMILNQVEARSLELMRDTLLPRLMSGQMTPDKSESELVVV